MSRGAQNKGNNYLKIPCEYCNVPIATNMIAPHYRNCKARTAFLAESRTERLQKMPLEHMTLGEVGEAGRMDELQKRMDELQKRLDDLSKP